MTARKLVIILTACMFAFGACGKKKAKKSDDPAPPDPMGPVTPVKAKPSWPKPVPNFQNVKVKAAKQITVFKTASVPALDPYHNAWKAAHFVNVKLKAQQEQAPRLLKSTLSNMVVQALHDGTKIAFRLEWKDPTANGNVDAGRFPDKAALMFPLDAGAVHTMGGKGKRVSIMYWNALWQKDIDVHFQDVQDVHPNYWTDLYWFASGKAPYRVPGSFKNPAAKLWFVAHRAGNPVAVFSRKTPVAEYVAEGFGSLTHQPQSASTAKGVWVNETWAVVITRPLKTSDSLDFQFAAGGKGKIGFAIWEGSAGNRGARKHFAAWLDFSVK